MSGPSGSRASGQRSGAAVAVRIADPGAWRASLAVVLAAGLILRVCGAWYFGPIGDTRAFAAAGSAFERFGFSFYSHVNAAGAPPYGARNYSYPPGYLPLLALADIVARSAPAGLHLHFWQVARVIPVVADVVLAAVVQAHLPRHRRVLRLLAAGAIVFGPSFVVASTLLAQLDAIAILPAVLAVLRWQREGRHRALVCGLLIGSGTSIKTVPFVLVLALLPTVASWREAARLVLAAVAVPAAALAPFVIADSTGAVAALRYSGLPGGGGLALLVQPQLASHYLGDYDMSSAYSWLQQWGWLLPAVAVLGTSLVLIRRRVPAVPAAAILWLVVYATIANWFPQYLAWGFPFTLLAGWVLPIVAADGVLSLTVLLQYHWPPGLSNRLSRSHATEIIYPALMDALWLAAAVSSMLWLLRAARPGEARPKRRDAG